MRKLILLFFFVSSALWLHAKDFTRYVSPLVGTQSTFELSTGNTYPAIARPWGMNFWTPQTGKMGDGWQYVYTANKIRGFKQTHQPSPWINDYGQFSIMPVVGKPEFDEEKRASWFSHKGEVALPHYYKVYLAEHDVVTEFTPTDRAVLFRFTFPENDHSYIVVDAFDKGSYVKILPEQNRIIGYTTRNSGGVPENFKNYFVIEFDKPFTYKASVADGVLSENKVEQEAGHAGAVIGFKTRKGEVVHARVASSFIGFEQADRNLKELGNDNLETLVQKGQDAWNKVLGRIDVEGGTLDQYRTFYSCLYRSLLFPRAFYELDEAGNPIHYSPYNGQVLPGYMYTDTGFWDTFRCLFPFLNLMYPSVNRQIQEGLVNTYKESGFFPEWASPGHRGCMIGNNSASVLADAYLKGFTGFDADRAYRYMVASSVYEKQNGVPYVLEKGYIPCDKVREATSIAMEYAADDWGIALMAKKMGKTEDYQNYLKRGKYYTQYFDKDINFIRPKMNDGSWRTPYDPIQSIHSVGDFCEGNGWHYTFFVPQHPEGLIELMGGDAPFISKLDSLFLVEGELGENASPDISGLIGMYAHGNEPSHHVTYLYPYAGEQWKTAEKVRYIQDVFYTDQPEGIIGNEDCGQMSAWHIMSALGFYQVNPSNGVFVFGSPLFDKASVHLPEGKTFEVVAQNNSKENVYIQSVLLNGKPYNNSYILYDDIVKGGNLTFVMGSTPNKEFGAAPENRPKTAE